MSEQKAITTPQNAGARIREDPERQAADGALRDRDDDAGANAGDHQVPRLPHQPIALVSRQGQQFAQLAADLVAVTHQEEQREQHRDKRTQRREHIGDDGTHARREEGRDTAHAFADGRSVGSSGRAIGLRALVASQMRSIRCGAINGEFWT